MTTHFRKSQIAKKNALVSVIAPAFNEEKVLKEFYRQVSSVLAGTGYPYEIVIVDDGSSDESLSLLKELRQRDDSRAYANDGQLESPHGVTLPPKKPSRVSTRIICENAKSIGPSWGRLETNEKA